MLQKKALDLGGGYRTERPLGGPSGTPNDPEAFGLALPIAAIMLASYGGYSLANKAADKKAKEERQKRIRENLNRLSKANLNILESVRKEAGIIGTMFNPLQGVRGLGGELYVPKWFTPTTSDEPTKTDALIFKTLALAGTYGTMAAGVKYLMSAMERQKELREGNKEIEAAVKATMPIVSPDPSLSDLAKEEREAKRGIKGPVIVKQSEEKPGIINRFLTEQATGVEDPKHGSAWGSIKAALLLLGVGAFGAGAMLSKRYFDDRDENRQRIKAAEKAAKRMALVERPPAIIGNIDPKIKKRLDKHIEEGRLKVTPKQVPLLEAGTIASQPVDPTDSLSRNIAAV